MYVRVYMIYESKEDFEFDGAQYCKYKKSCMYVRVCMYGMLE